jgi:outer membrane protein TolC
MGFLFIFLCNQFSFAVEFKSLTLLDCISTAMDQSPDMAGPNQQVELATLGLQQAKAQYLPRFGLNVSYGINVDDKGGISTGDVSGGFFVNYDIFNGSYRRANVERAKASLQMALYQKKQSEINLVSAIIKSFYDILKGRHRMDMAKQSVDNAQKNLRQLQIRFDSGLVDSTELSNSKLILQESQSGVDAAQHALDQSYAELNRLMGIGLKSDVQLTPSPFDSIQLKTMQEYTGFALDNRMDLKIALENQKIAEFTLKYAKLGKLPKLNLFTTGNIPITGSGNASFVLTPNIYWQIYDAGDVHFQIEYAKQNLYSAQTAYQVLKTKIALEVQKAYNAVLEFQQAEDLANQRITLVNENFRKSEIRFQSGEIAEFDYQQANQNRLRAELQKTDSEYDLILAQANLQQYTGMEILKITAK